MSPVSGLAAQGLRPRVLARRQFLVQGRYLEQAVPGEVASQNTQAARLQDTIGGQRPGAARNARAELGEIINQAVTARRKQHTWALEWAMQEVCVAGAVGELAHELNAVHVDFLADADRQSELEQVIEDLARDWEGRTEVQLPGPKTAYNFVTTAAPDR
jgi:Gas vesicle synthesis protein GvpL/GvpF